MIKTRGLTKIFKIGKKQETELIAVDNLSLEVERGEVFGFLGPNGAGKTTTVRMLTGLIRPSAGSAQVAGFELGKEDTNIRRNVGILTESPGMYERLTAEKNLTIFANLYDVPDVEKSVNKYLSMLGLWERRHDTVGSFSKGMRQKLAVARALIHEPQILFLDEPTTGLDPEASKTVRDFIEELKTEGRTIFMTTHNLDEAERLCDRVGIFQQKLLTLDSPASLRDKMFGRKVVFHLRELQASWVNLVAGIAGAENVEAVDNKLVVSLKDPEERNPEIIKALVLAGAQVQFVGEIRHSLEQIYLEMVQSHERGQA
ncbi:MAG: ABC transporter ATP-binding protein [Anaerolineaceae bacterium]|jgi:ABC-2 type transport system ATP-binding protein|nr:ABC transporter ATP-binding protein [Anaerolineaceae bacterium]MDD4042726.1 ABC transporter ATP-binding protein [Anaerolineaceae bacterium]MDD4577065.1 ABC transporter ATP-binding protein [Anaerolineaceae bacterium]